MLFNSYQFLFVFLPATLAVYFLIGHSGSRDSREKSHRYAILWLLLASILFYASWSPLYVALIGASVVLNYFVGDGICRAASPAKRKFMLIGGVAFNLLFLGYFKYTNFLISNANTAFGLDVPAQQIILPLGISFVTFLKIAYLVDLYREPTRNYRFVDYCLFVTFFPHLIAGPILHHAEMIPQFYNKMMSKFDPERISVGITVFVIGLAKKVLIADNISEYASPVFNAAAVGIQPTFFEAWGGAVAYALQLYFDFSGYSDMAVGLGYMMGVKLPVNFNSPYKASSIIDFWRRWHITLSRFLREYLYIPLGGNRSGSIRRYSNILVTMLLGGLWHGANWTFVIWGGIHGLLLVVNHGWRAVCRQLGISLGKSRAWYWASRLLTFLVVVIAWVFFRADDLSSAMRILSGMAGQNGIAVPVGYSRYLSWIPQIFPSIDVRFLSAEEMFNFYFATVRDQVLLTGGFLAIAWFMPNTQDIMARFRPALAVHGESEPTVRTGPAWRPDIRWALAIALLCAVAIPYVARVREFIYFQF